MGRVSSKQNTREHVFGAKHLDYHCLSSSSLPWFPKLRSKPPISRFCWHFLFVFWDWDHQPKADSIWATCRMNIVWVFCVCVCVLLFDLRFLKVLNLFWTFPKLANFLYTTTVPVSLAKSERSGNAPSTPRFHVAGAEWWLLSIKGACALWFSSVSATPCVTSLVLGTLDTPLRPQE